MAEVNEEIAKAYFEEICRYFVETDHYFKKSSKKAHKRGGTGPSDIDLLLLHPTEGIYGKRAMVSVKGWHGYVLNSENCKKNYKWMHGFEKQDLDAAEDRFKSKDFSKILVVPRINEEEREEVERYAKECKGIDYIITFPFMLKEIFDKIGDSSRYYKESEVLHTLTVSYRHYITPIIEENIKLKKDISKLERR